MKSDRGKALLSREASGYFSQKVAAPTPKGTDRAARAERCLYQLCRVVTDEPEGNHLSMQNTWKPFTGAAQLPL